MENGVIFHLNFTVSFVLKMLEKSLSCCLAITRITHRDLICVFEGGVQKGAAEGSDVTDRYGTRPLQGDALRHGRLHAGNRHAG